MPGQPRPPLRFSKMHGAGNDFVVLDLRDGTPPPDAALSRALADRHRGVGCDQILTIEPAVDDGAVASYRIWNSDGGNAAQCGNGARCVAAWLVRDGAAHGDRFSLDSLSGRHEVERLGDDRYRIAMGVPRFEPAAIPLHGFDRVQDEYALQVDGREDAPVAGLGRALQRHPAFPDSVNVGFARIESREAIHLRVFERGVGETHACGSGACAAAAILVRRGLGGRELWVRLPGGILEIGWKDSSGPITMAGPAAFVFEGEFAT